MPRRGLILFMLLVSPLLIANKPALPDMVVHAHYVFVTTYFGGQAASAKIPSDDRSALVDVQDAIRKWGRYMVVFDQKKADLIILVRRGRIAMAQPRTGIQIDSGPSRTSIGTYSKIEADAGDPRDMLAVYDATQGTDSPPLWRKLETDGLKAPEMRLLNEFRTRVEAAAQKP
jgi:hypothetical protein